METCIYLDLELIRNIAFVYVFVGMVWLFIVLRMSMKYQEDHEFISEKLGIVILTSVLGWPYNLFCWVFSSDVWLMPVGDLMRRLVPSAEIRVLIFLSLALLLILNLVHIWFFIANPS